MHHSLNSVVDSQTSESYETFLFSKSKKQNKKHDMYCLISQTNDSEMVLFCESKTKCDQYRLIHKQMALLF